MNAKLLSAVTTFDDDAQLDEQAILKLKKQQYVKSIATVNSGELAAKRDFGLKPINANFLNSSFLNDNTHFKEIKAVFVAYNAMVASQPTDPIAIRTYQVDELHIRPVLVDSLLKFMRLVMLTPDRDVQARMLSEVHSWYKEQVTKREYKSQLQRFFDQQLERRLEQVRKAIKPPPSNLPNQIIKAQKAAYLRNNRTDNKEIHAPEHQLKDYKRRILNFDEATEQMKIVVPSLNSRIKYERPPPLNFHKELESVAEPASKEHNATSMTTNANLSTEVTDLTAQHILLPDGSQPAVPPVEEQAGNNILDDFGIGEEEEEGQPQPEVEEEGKLDPRIKNYIYPSTNYSETAETRMHNRMLRMQHQIEQRGREDMAKYQSMKDWSRHRCRLQSQLTRKIQATKEYSMIAAAETKIYRAKTQATEKFIDLSREEQPAAAPYQNSINTQRLEEVKRFGLRAINYQKGDPVHKQPSMSVFDRKRPQKQNRSLSEILDQHSRQKQRENSLDEIQQIKQRFAKYKIPVQLSRVGEGLLHPNELPSAKLETFGPLEVHLPSNPFMKVTKKKKKKK